MSYVLYDTIRRLSLLLNPERGAEVECLPSMCDALGLIPGIQKMKQPERVYIY